MPETSTKPYLIRAIYEWCTDNGYTPYIAVAVNANTRVPMEFVKNNEIVLNISFEATSKLKMGNDLIEFHARFGGVSREISIPIDNVAAIYARENGQGMAFPIAPLSDEAGEEPNSTAASIHKLTSVDNAITEKNDKSVTDVNPEPPEPDGPKPTGRPSLKRIK
ncbi:ClpXP protease specificity-enhancing factor [Ampullimonas aquatilis]|uniref:ClpXP protease specificity-enhancing factor n=1 Tax=Ampullimonas aquatilis TaxID=1341549 RepID=UPI003C719B34